MIATNTMGLVPADFLTCASCLLPDRAPPLGWASSLTVNRPDNSFEDRILNPLSPTERRVLPMVLAGLADKEIANVLGRSLPTVKHHVGAILRKHRVSSRARLMAVLREAAGGKPEPELLRRFGA